MITRAVLLFIYMLKVVIWTRFLIDGLAFGPAFGMIVLSIACLLLNSLVLGTKK